MALPIHEILTRVAVVQLAYHPAILADRRSPLEDPLFDPKRPESSLLPAGGEVPDALVDDLAALQRRVRETYDAQLLAKVQTVLEQCRAWNVRIVVFPEYSIPWEILGGVADAAGDIVVVAGTHTVERAGRKSGIYQRLVAPNEPAVGLSVCPVLHLGRLLALQAKLNPATPERASMRSGEAWAPVVMPDGIPGPMGVLVCLDFLFRDGEQYRALVAESLKECRFLAVPSLTPTHTLPEFAGKAWEEARRYGRPVLYCDAAEGGGTSVYVDEGQTYDLRRFPERAGYLEAGDEGVIVADVNLGFERAGSSTRYHEVRAVVPVAEATFVYRSHPAGLAYAGWLEQAAFLFERDDDDALDAIATRVERDRDLLLDAGALSGAAARGRRLKRLVADLDRVTSVEDMRRFTREIVMPDNVLPLGALRAAMAGACADVMFDWLKRRGVKQAGFAEVEERLRKAVEAINGGPWTSEGASALATVAQFVRGARPDDKAPSPSEAQVKVVLPSGIDPAALGKRHHDGYVLSFCARATDLLDEAFLAALFHGGRTQRGPTAQPWPRFSASQVHLTERLRLLAIAEGGVQVAAIGVWPEGGSNNESVIFVISSHGADRKVWSNDVLSGLLQGKIRSVLEQDYGLLNIVMGHVPPRALESRVGALVSRFDGGRKHVQAYQKDRLREVQGQFVEPHARVDGGEREPALAALDRWLASNQHTALVLGEFGSGKSTVLAEWARRCWEQERGPRPILVNLAGAPASADTEQLLLVAAGSEDTPSGRAALRLLITAGLIIPCFDGFDEMATRLDPSDLAGRLSMLIEVARGGGKVIVSSRDNYFPSEANLKTTTESALERALGASGGFRRIVIQPLTDGQIRELVEKIKPSDGAADEALARIAGIYDLRDLVHRPLLLGMVLATLDNLGTEAKVGRADLYEAYLTRWLDQTRSGDPDCFTDEQKKEFAEALADQLWRSGSSSCTWQDLQLSVHARLQKHLPETMPLGAAFLEIQGGAFFVREGDDRYRFAHKSFLEYFLARSLVASLPERPGEVLDTKRITQEVAEFVGEILRRERAPEIAPAVAALQRFLTDGRKPLIAPFVTPAYGTTQPPGLTAEAAANALRLLLGLSRWAHAADSWMPEGADLRGVRLDGEDLHGALLVRADLSGAELAGANLSGVNFTEAVLDGANLTGARLDQVVLVRARARRTNFTQVEADQAILTGADLTEAVLRQSTWTACQWGGVRATHADVTGSAAPGSIEIPDVLSVLVLLSSDTRAALVTGHESAVCDVAWQPDGKRLASAGDDGTVRVWDAGTAKELARLEGHKGGVRAVVWHPDGTQLASAGSDGTVRVWDVVTAKELARFEGHTKAVYALAWNPDRKRIASAAEDGTVRVWDAATAKELGEFKGHKIAVHAIAWHPTGKRLVSAGMDGTVRLWDAETWQELAKLLGYKHSVIAVAWHPEGKWLVSAGSDRTLHLWDTETKKEVAQLKGHETGLTAVAWHPQGKLLASAGNDGSLRLWDVGTRAELVQFEGHRNKISALAWQPNGERLASAGFDTTVRLWDAETGTELVRIDGHTIAVGAVAWHPNGQRLACAGYDGTVRIWDAAAAKELVRLDGHKNGVRAVAWHPDGKWLASAGYDGVLRVWDAETANELVRLDGHDGGVSAVAWCSDRIRLASAGDDGTVRLWDAVAATELGRLGSYDSRVRAVSWHPDGTRLASARDDGAVQVWDTETMKELARLEGHPSGVNSVAWHFDGQRIVTAGYDGTVRVWNADAAKELTRFEGHANGVNSVVWHAGGKRLASAGYDGTVRVWDVETNKEVARLEGHAGGVYSVAWHSDGKRLASAGYDGMVRVWDSQRKVLLGVFAAAGLTTLGRSAGGYCTFSERGPERVRLALCRPEPGSRSVLYLPLAGLRTALHRPDKVAAALGGDLTGDDLSVGFEALGLANGVVWNGNVQILPDVSLAGFTTRKDAIMPGQGSFAMTLPNRHENPFRPGPAITDASFLAGREPILDELLALINSRSPAVLCGPRRSGKTSLLHTLRNRLTPSRLVRHITLEGRAEPIRTADDLALILEPSLALNATPADTLRERLRNEATTVLLLDEIANLTGAEPTLFAWLRAVGQEQTSLVLVGSPWDWLRVVARASEAEGSSFGNDVTPVDLGPISDADAIIFLTNASPADVRFAPDNTARWIVDRCGPWPFYLQVMGYSIVQAVRAGRRKALVDVDGVSEIYEQRLLLDRNAAFFGTRWAELPQRVQRVLGELRSLPAGKFPTFRDLSPEDRKDLLGTGLCNAYGHWLDDKPFYDWIRRIADLDGGRN